jgi:N-acyl-D-aspartate/D-glutamate deacylase
MKNSSRCRRPCAADVAARGNLALKERGLLKAGYFADIVVFDPATIQDHATFEKPSSSRRAYRTS